MENLVANTTHAVDESSNLTSVHQLEESFDTQTSTLDENAGSAQNTSVLRSYSPRLTEKRDLADMYNAYKRKTDAKESLKAEIKKLRQILNRRSVRIELPEGKFKFEALDSVDRVRIQRQISELDISLFELTQEISDLSKSIRISEMKNKKIHRAALQKRKDSLKIKKLVDRVKNIITTEEPTVAKDKISRIKELANLEEFEQVSDELNEFFLKLPKGDIMQLRNNENLRQPVIKQLTSYIQELSLVA